MRAFSRFRSCCDGIGARSTAKRPPSGKKRAPFRLLKTLPKMPEKFVSLPFNGEESAFDWKGLKKVTKQNQVFPHPCRSRRRYVTGTEMPVSSGRRLRYDELGQH
jgi:hypothetical protein